MQGTKIEKTGVTEPTRLALNPHLSCQQIDKKLPIDVACVF